MATVSQWTPFGVALDITATGSTVTRKSATQFTVKINASWKTHWSGAQTNYGMTASSGGGSATINKFGTKASSGSGSFTGTYSISGNGAATKTITVTFKNFNSDNGNSATKTVSFNVSVPAWTSYTIKYNANGGTGAPSSQTKWKDQKLTLSSTKPTRTGYTFKGWATSASGAVAYASGATYTANAAVTLYAVWQAITYPVKFDANGGTGAPSSQTKTYGVTLQLSTTIPTKTNYNFLGWATAASATKATYLAGDNYTANSAVTLYAIWELAYVKPRISNLTVRRGTWIETEDDPRFPLVQFVASDEGTSGILEFSWERYPIDNAVMEITIKWAPTVVTEDDVGGSQILPSNDAISDDEVVYLDSISADKTYIVTVTLNDGTGITSMGVTIPGTEFAIDVLAEGKGIAFGKPAELAGVADFGWSAKFNKHVYGTVMGLNRLPEIPADSNFDTYLDYECWAVYSNDNAATIANMPVQKAGRLEVSSSTGEGSEKVGWAYITQRFIPYHNAEGEWTRLIIRSPDETGEGYIYTYGGWLKHTSPENVIYDNSYGSADTISLSKSAAEFRYLEIYYTDNNGKAGGYTKVYKPNGTNVCLHIQEAAQTTIYSRQTRYIINGKYMTPDIASASYVRTSQDGAVSASIGTNYIKIIRVIGLA